MHALYPYQSCAGDSLHTIKIEKLVEKGRQDKNAGIAGSARRTFTR